MEWYRKPGKFQTSIDGFSIVRRDVPSDFERHLYTPMIILQLQGGKCAILGSHKYVYGENQYMVSTVCVSAVSKVTEATSKTPFLSIALELNSNMIMQLLAVDNPPTSKITNESQLWFIGSTDLLLLDAFLRLTLLLEQPINKQQVLSDMKKGNPLLLLTDPVGSQMRAIATKGTHYNKIAEAVDVIQKSYREKLHVQSLAEQMKIATSSFYRYFKKVTTLSPIQYQKQLRLYEAQRLMLSEGYNAQDASYMVGYEGSTQFNRKYKKLFGIPPKASVKKLVN